MRVEVENFRKDLAVDLWCAEEAYLVCLWDEEKAAELCSSIQGLGKCKNSSWEGTALRGVGFAYMNFIKARSKEFSRELVCSEYKFDYIMEAPNFPPHNKDEMIERIKEWNNLPFEEKEKLYLPQIDPKNDDWLQGAKDFYDGLTQSQKEVLLSLGAVEAMLHYKWDRDFDARAFIDKSYVKHYRPKWLDGKQTDTEIKLKEFYEKKEKELENEKKD